MASAENLIQWLDLADVRRNPYAVAEAAATLAEMGDVRGVAHHVRALAALGLGAAARRVAAGLPTTTDFAAIRETVQGLPAGLVPWASRRRRFTANLQAMQVRGIAIEKILAAWENEKAAERYELHMAADGNAHVFDTAQSQKPWAGWVGGLQDFKNAVAQIKPESFKGQLRAPLAFDGVGHGWLIPHILTISENSYLNYNGPLYIVEPDLISLVIMLHLQDLAKWIEGPRLRLFLGEEATPELIAALESHPGWTPPGTFVCNPLRPRAGQNLQARVEELYVRRQSLRQMALERVQAHYAAIDFAAWRKRYAEALAGGDPLRILGITTRYSTVLRFSMEELQAAATTCGIPLEMEICMESDDQSLEKDYVAMIDRWKPDLLVTISRMRYEMPDLPRNIPALCWDQDNLQCMRDPGALTDMKGLTFVAGHGAVFGAMHLGWPENACIFCHAAGMTHRYHPLAASPDEIREFGSDVSYISHASASPREFRETLRSKWIGGASDFLPLLDACLDEIEKCSSNGRPLEFLDLKEIAERISKELRLPLPANVLNALMTDMRLLGDRLFRHQTLQWVSDWCESRGRRLRIWGNGWDRHPTFGKWAAGSALPGAQVHTVYRTSAINLQIIETGILHSRLLDGWAAGGFFLIRQAHRPQDERRIQTCHQIGVLSEKETIESIGDLEKRGSAELKSLWQEVAAEYAAFGRNMTFPGFRMWRSLIPPQVLIPGLGHITYNNRDEFGRLADRYMASESERQMGSQRVKEVLDAHLSYDARWRGFIRHISENLGYSVK